MTAAGLGREVLALPNRRGERMVTVVTRPVDAPPAPRVFVFCQAGLQSKSGVGDYFRWLGDELAVSGNVVVRFDQAGTGDSQGAISEGVVLNEYFRSVQAGVSANDVLDVLTWVHATLAPREIVLLGQCGGCISAVVACARQPRLISGLVLLALPVLLTPVEQTIRTFDARTAWRGYLEKLTRPQAYHRLLRGESDFALIGAALRELPRRATRRLEGLAGRLRRDSRPDHPRFNQLFWEAFCQIMSRKQRVLFLMAELDNETPEFDQEFRDKVLRKLPRWSPLCTITYLRQADHSLMFDPGRRASRDAILRWL